MMGLKGSLELVHILAGMAAASGDYTDYVRALYSLWEGADGVCLRWLAVLLFSTTRNGTASARCRRVFLAIVRNHHGAQ